MTDVYNLSGFANGTSMLNLSTTVNTATDGLLALFIMFVSAIVVMIMLKNSDFKAQAYSGLGIAMIEGVIFYAIGWMSVDYLVMIFAVIVLFTLWILWD